MVGFVECHAEPIVELGIEINPFGGDQAGRRLCPDTLAWWAARLGKGHPIPGIDSENSLGHLVSSFLTIWENFGTRDTQLWCWGLDFDVPIIANILEAHGHKPGWSYKLQGCIRTLCRELAIEWPEGHTPAHRALADAQAEASMLRRALRRIGPRLKGGFA
jgi:hypothetical protein